MILTYQAERMPEQIRLKVKLAIVVHTFAVLVVVCVASIIAAVCSCCSLRTCCSLCSCYSHVVVVFASH